MSPCGDDSIVGCTVFVQFSWHLRCTVLKGSDVSVGQSEKQTVKYVKNSELKRICYKEPFRGNSDCLATYAGWRTTGS